MGYFETFADFVKMGTHGPFVWSVYGLTVAALLWQWWSFRQMRSRVLQRARRWHSDSREDRQ